MSVEAAVSLYLDLEEGQAADMEVVARAALAFSAAIKALALDLAPEAEVRVELLSGTEGSLSLNSKIKGLGLLVTKERLVNVALGIIAYIALESRDYTVGRVLDHYFGKADAQAESHLSDEDIQRVVEAMQKGSAAPQIRQMFKEVERDPTIKGVGATDQPGQRPSVIVPRSEFYTRAGVAPQETTITRRTTQERMTVVLVSPVLVEGKRRWKFRGPHGEFGAPVKDADFIHSVLIGTTPVPMVAGIVMDIEVETDEERTDGVWIPGDRRVTRVYDVKPPETVEQASLFATLGQDNEDDD